MLGFLYLARGGELEEFGARLQPSVVGFGKEPLPSRHLYLPGKLPKMMTRPPSAVE